MISVHKTINFNAAWLIVRYSSYCNALSVRLSTQSSECIVVSFPLQGYAVCQFLENIFISLSLFLSVCSFYNVSHFYYHTLSCCLCLLPNFEWLCKDVLEAASCVWPILTWCHLTWHSMSHLFSELVVLLTKLQTHWMMVKWCLTNMFDHWESYTVVKS